MKRVDGAVVESSPPHLHPNASKVLNPACGRLDVRASNTGSCGQDLHGLRFLDMTFHKDILCP